MKTLGIVLLALMLPLAAAAQDETLLGDGPVVIGGYGAPVTQYTSIHGAFGLLIGGRAGLIINHTFVIGCAGYGLANDVEANTPGPYGEPYLNLGYGGLQLEVVLQSDRVVHYSLRTLIGGGGVGFRNAWMDGYHEPDHEYMDGFFVLEPGVDVDVNVTKWFRTSLGVSYRYVDGISSPALTDSDLRGPSAMLSFRFGSF